MVFFRKRELEFTLRFKDFEPLERIRFFYLCKQKFYNSATQISDFGILALGLKKLKNLTTLNLGLRLSIYFCIFGGLNRGSSFLQFNDPFPSIKVSKNCEPLQILIRVIFLIKIFLNRHTNVSDLGLSALGNELKGLKNLTILSLDCEYFFLNLIG